MTDLEIIAKDIKLGIEEFLRRPIAPVCLHHDGNAAYCMISEDLEYSVQQGYFVLKVNPLLEWREIPLAHPNLDWEIEKLIRSTLRELNIRLGR